MCFLPKSRASIDQAPGPIIAKVAPRAASMMGIHGSPGCEKESDPRFNDYYQRSDHGSPQTDKEKRPRTNCNELGDWRKLMCFTEAGDKTTNQPGGSYHPQE